MRKLVSTFLTGEKLFYGLLVLTPFLVSTRTTEAFEFPKMYFVYLAGSLFGLMAFIKRLREADGKKNLDTSRLVVLLPVSFGISTIFSTHLYTSLWGYFSRFNGGLVSVLIFFSVYLSVLYLKPKTHGVLKTVAFTLVPISLYAILQHFGLGGTWATDTTVRAFSTFGQPNWYGAYCAMVLPIVLYLGLKGDPHSRVGVMRSSVSWFALFVLGFTGFWFSYSVSGILGLACSSILVLGLNLRSTERNWRLLIVVAGLCLTVAVLNQGIFNQKITDALTAIFTKPSITIQSLGVLPPQSPEVAVNTQTPESPGYQLTDSGFIRKGIWEGAVKLWLTSPKNFLIGTGPETFPYEFQKFRPPSLNYSSEWNFILNKPHNYYLELLAQNGLFGLLVYLLIALKTVLARHSALTPALVGVFVTNFFGWPTVSTTLLFWIFLALLTIDSYGKLAWTSPNLVDRKPPAPNPKLSALRNTVPLFSLAIVLYLFANLQFGRHVLADMFSKASDKYFETGESQKALNFSSKAVELNPNEPFYYRQRAKTYMLTTVGQSDNRISQIKDTAHKDVSTAYNLNPLNLATLRGEISLYYFLALRNLSATANGESQATQTDSHYLQLAQEYYSNLSQSYPSDVGVQAQIAKYQKMLGLWDDLEETVSTIRKLRPDLLDWYINF